MMVKNRIWIPGIFLDQRTLNYNMFTIARIGIDLDVGWSQTLISNPLVQLDFDGIGMIWLLPCGLWVNVLNILSTSAKEIVCFFFTHIMSTFIGIFYNWVWELTEVMLKAYFLVLSL